MKLKDYIEKYDINKREFCKILNIDYSALHHWLHGNRRPNIENAMKIQDFTNNKVKPQDFFDAKS
jgi:predicted transcriptional regulator